MTILRDIIVDRIPAQRSRTRKQPLPTRDARVHRLAPGTRAFLPEMTTRVERCEDQRILFREPSEQPGLGVVFNHPHLPYLWRRRLKPNEEKASPAVPKHQSSQDPSGHRGLYDARSDKHVHGGASVVEIADRLLREIQAPPRRISADRTIGDDPFPGLQRRQSIGD